jgi:hypothetical protein
MALYTLLPLVCVEFEFLVIFDMSSLASNKSMFCTWRYLTISMVDVAGIQKNVQQQRKTTAIGVVAVTAH